MNVVRGAIYFQRSAMETIYQATQITMQPGAQLFGDEGHSIFRSINDVIEEIRVRHSEIVTRESSES